MAANLMNLNTGFPRFAQGESVEARLRKLESYLYQVMEQLRYTLNNLDGENFNDKGLEELGRTILVDGLTITAADGDNKSTIKIMAGGVEVDSAEVRFRNITADSVSADNVTAGTLRGVELLSENGLDKVRIANGSIAFLHGSTPYGSLSEDGIGRVLLETASDCELEIHADGMLTLMAGRVKVLDAGGNNTTLGNPAVNTILTGEYVQLVPATGVVRIYTQNGNFWNFNNGSITLHQHDGTQLGTVAMR